MLANIIRITLACLFFVPTLSSAENHWFTNLPLDSKGWTDFQALTDSGYSSARVLFVSSSSGNDTSAENHIADNGHYRISDVTFDSDGIFQSPENVSPFATIQTAYAYCRDGFPDILLLERGSTWTSGVSGSVNSGASQSAPHIIATYGSSGNRPQLTDVMLDCDNADCLIVSGIHFYSAEWTSAGRAVETRGDPDYQTFEDLFFTQKAGDIIQGQSGSYASYIAFRRCHWYHGEAHDGQLFAQHADYVLIEECSFQEPFDDDYADESRFGRFFYFSSEPTGGGSEHDFLNHVYMLGNVFYNGERDAVDLRSGGDFKYNLVVASDYNHFGGRGGSEDTIQSVDIEYNAFLEGPPNVSGYNGIHLINIDGGTINENILTDNTNIGPYGYCLSIAGDGVCLWIARNIDITNNIFYGRSAAFNLRTNRTLEDVQNITISNNDFQLVNGSEIILQSTWDEGRYRFEGYTYQNNRYYSSEAADDWFTPCGSYSDWVSESGETGSSSIQLSYSAPSRTVGSYNQSLGGSATTADFMASVRAQARHNWDPDLLALSAVNYFRSGFDEDSAAYSYKSYEKNEQSCIGLPAIPLLLLQ